jgi:hypothetical protein
MRRPQFRLRSLFILTAIVAVLFWVGSPMFSNNRSIEMVIVGVLVAALAACNWMNMFKRGINENDFRRLASASEEELPRVIDEILKTTGCTKQMLSGAAKLFKQYPAQLEEVIAHLSR